MRDDFVITETEENGRYEARAFYRGRVISRVFWRDDVYGWPWNYKQRAHEQVRQQAAMLDREQSQEH